LFFDEVQDCPRAKSSLKSFSEDGRYDVISSGSLLGVTNLSAGSNGKEGISPLSPMGYEKIVVMRSMDFEEYLWASGFPIEVLEDVKCKIRKRVSLSKTELEVLSGHFRDYMIVGGMPASVRDFFQYGSFSRSGEQQDAILAEAVNDINRYNDPINARKTQKCFESIPGQLSQGNKRFHYSRVDGTGGSRGTAEKYMTNLTWVEGAGYGNFCYALESPNRPFKVISDNFKVYLSDTGLLVRMMGRGAAMAVHDGDSAYNLGAVTENEIAECLMKNGIPIRFYHKSSGKNQMEIDFVVELLDQSVAIEVKSGKHRDAPSISKINDVFHVDRRIMFENGNISVDGDGIEHYPLFVAAFIRCLEREYDGPEFR
ncbi:MAG: ATP-binding protein, partial [Candidatus Methanomethylophilaceae archaeon]|nr:ATP-binding protein [Candidatus Methanomethylophilaceae archaeon]